MSRQRRQRMDQIEQAYMAYCELKAVALDAADGDSNDDEIEALTDALDQAGLLIELYRELTGEAK
ncbi:hypothetical protein ACFQZ4_11205 [Catellatospora coxensis]